MLHMIQSMSLMRSHNNHTLSRSRNESPSHSTREREGDFSIRPAKPEAFVERLLPVFFHSFNILYLVDNFLILALGLEVHGEADDGTNGSTDDGAYDH